MSCPPMLGPERGTAEVALALVAGPAGVTAARRTPPPNRRRPRLRGPGPSALTSLEGGGQPIVSTEVWTTASMASEWTGWLKQDEDPVERHRVALARRR